MFENRNHGGRQEIIAGRRSISLELFLILPLVIIYEIGLRCSDTGLRNAAEAALKDFCRLMGTDAFRVFHLALAVVIVLCFMRTYSRNLPFLRIFALVVFEGIVLAAVMGPFLSILIGGLPLQYQVTMGSENELSSSLLLSIGAGLYEEFFFRFLLLGGLFVLCRRVFKAPTWFSAILSIFLSSLLFSVYHHVGYLASPVDCRILLFRMFAGVFLGIVFIFRGFGVAVYLHAFYDIFRDIETALWAGA